MPIIKASELYRKKFMDTSESKIDLALGALEVLYCVASSKEPSKDDKYKLILKLTEAQFNEVQQVVIDAVHALAEDKGIKLTDKQIEAAIEHWVGESTKEPGTFRFYCSKKMFFTDKETGEFKPFDLTIYDKEVDDTKLLSDVKFVNKGSIVKTQCTLNLFKLKSGSKAPTVSIEPQMIVVVKMGEYTPKNTVSFDGLDDAYDF